MKKWLADKAVDLATVVVLVVGLGFTVWQIRETNRTLLAANAYTIHKDAREVADLATSDEDFVTCITNPAGEDCSGDTRIKAMSRMSSIFNFYYSIYRMQNAGRIDFNLVDIYSSDFCIWFDRGEISKFVEASWDNTLKLGTTSDEYKTMRREWCVRGG